ncbi:MULTISPECIES: hypothetical protein [Prochlorococcus]|uniref:Uncharacterized protein n=1 Tax=Prochlorococcus marinus str. MIT 9116 TaxID=167544 RepID=A0A0A1ZPM7_PROMR|nr:hypothetical protein [Prochlorococcus marinus]KGF89368.1 hypothetical protein EU92_1924 [Prochlorococcus marinus str. MIT 9107]KGF90123.1 hypothetical protein EU93_1987 [Prochlorococcus marinus str. MIT 9116]KGF94416.1 hypothetical protein EU94_0565 [Prochlorococcus marinus str. MIT 9123]
MRRKNEQQIGITNDIITRMQTHKSKGWKEVDKIGPIKWSTSFKCRK